MREPVDPGPDTQPSLEAMPDPLEPPDHPEPLRAQPKPVATAVDDNTRPATPSAEAPPPGPLPVPAQPVAVPGQYHYLKRRTFVLVLIGVWIPAALIGLGLYNYWFHLIHKRPAVFLVLMLIVVCTVAAQLLAMVEHKPLITAVAIAVLSAPFAATAAAAALYGAYALQWIPR